MSAAQANVISTAVKQMIMVAPVIVRGGGVYFFYPDVKFPSPSGTQSSSIKP